MRSWMAFTESRAGGGKVAFSRSMRRIEAVCGPSFGYLRLLGPYGLGSGWSSILRTVLGLTPVSRATCRIEAPSRRIRRRMPDHCATSRYMVVHPSTLGMFGHRRAGSVGAHSLEEPGRGQPADCPL